MPSPSYDTTSSTTATFFDQSGDNSNSLGARDLYSETNINLRGIGHWVNDSAIGMQHWESLSSYENFDSRMPGINLDSQYTQNHVEKAMKAFEISLHE